MRTTVCHHGPGRARVGVLDPQWDKGQTMAESHNRHVRKKKPTERKKKVRRVGSQGLNGPVRHLPIALVFIAVRKGTQSTKDGSRTEWSPVSARDALPLPPQAPNDRIPDGADPWAGSPRGIFSPWYRYGSRAF